MMENDTVNLVSIIIVAKNAEKTIGECLARIRGQNYPGEKIEILVIDGGSTDKTIDIISKYHSNISIYISEPDNGLYDAMNKGIQLATGSPEKEVRRRFNF